MKKILEKIGKDELLEYSRLGDKFSVGNYIGSSNNFHIFTSINPYGKYEGYKFLKEEELKRLGRNKWYLELMKEEMKERELNEGKTIILEKDKFFKNLFKYFIENKIPSERIHEFLEFSIIEKPEIKKHMKTGNQTQVMMILEELFPIYHKRLEMNNIDNKK